MLCDDFNDKYFSRIIAHLGDHRDVHALIGQGLHHTSCFNHSAQGDHSRSAKFQNGCLMFFLMITRE